MRVIAMKILEFEIAWLREAVENLRLFDIERDPKARKALLRYALDHVMLVIQNCEKKKKPLRLDVRLVVDALHARLPSKARVKLR